MLSAQQLEKLFELDESTLRRVMNPSKKNRPKTLKKVIDRYAILTARPKQMELHS